MEAALGLAANIDPAYHEDGAASYPEMPAMPVVRIIYLTFRRGQAELAERNWKRESID